MSPLDKSQIRLLILTTNWNPGSTAFTVDYIYNGVLDQALTRKLLDHKPTAYAASLLEIAVLDVIWELVLEGVFAPGSTLRSSSLPYLRITEHGKKCLEAGQLTPHDPSRYLERIRKQNPSIDQTTLLYLGEALQTFKAGNHLATAVMVGVTAENLLLRLVDSVRAALDTTARQNKFDHVTKGKSSKILHDEVLARLKSPSNPLPANLQSNVEEDLDGIFALIRKSRNDAGHPTGRRFERSETHALLLLFPVYCKMTHELMDWLSVNKI